MDKPIYLFSILPSKFLLRQWINIKTLTLRKLFIWKWQFTTLLWNIIFEFNFCFKEKRKWKFLILFFLFNNIFKQEVGDDWTSSCKWTSISQGHVIKGLCDIIGRCPSREAIILPSLIAIDTLVIEIWWFLFATWPCKTTWLKLCMTLSLACQCISPS